MSKRGFQAIPRLVLTLHLVLTGASPISAKESTRPNFYISASAILVHSELIAVRGASNLPTGAILVVYIYDNRSKTFNDEVTAVVRKSGLFEASVTPKNGMSFNANLFCFITFSPDYPKQPKEVLRRVGIRGDRLGFPHNPQAILQTPNYQFLEETTVVRH